MKRGPALERRTPLVAKTPLARRTSLVARAGLTNTAPLQRTPMVRAVKRTGPVTSVRALVAKRDCQTCVVCGGPSTNQHHRQNRGSGGSSLAAINSPANLLSVCGSGTTGCHGWIESHRTGAEAAGYIVRRPTDPASVPVRVHGVGLVLLTADGRRIPQAVAA